MKVCAVDDCENESRIRSGATGPHPKYCSNHDRRIPNTYAPVRCVYCEAKYVPRIKTQKYCTKRCALVATGKARPEPLPNKVCALPECGIVFTPFHTWQRGCTARHGSMLYNRESRADGRQKPAPWDDRRKEQYHRRRALKRGSATAGGPVVLADIAARDHWQCGICKQRIKPEAKYPDPRSASLDHILPLSAGGQHDPSNVRLACLVCNSGRGNRYADEPIMLFG